MSSYLPTLYFNYYTTSVLNPGDFVILYKINATSSKVKKAVIDPYNIIFGFVLSGYNIGDLAQVYPLNSVNTALLGLIPGNTYYSDPAVAGAVTNVLPVGTEVIQQLGIALSATELDTQYSFLIDGSGGGGGGGLVCPTSDTLVDGGTFVSPCSNTLIDAGSF
jgi:hypothetical protein